MPQLTHPTRVVTGLRDDSTSYFASVETVDEDDYSKADLSAIGHAYPRWSEGEHPIIHVVWGAAGVPFALPIDPSDRTAGEVPASGGGVRVSRITYPPGWKGEFFWTNTVDFFFIISGELTYETDGGEKVILRQGDILVQNGTNKALHNESDDFTTMGVVMCGAVREGLSPPLDARVGP